MTLDQRIKVHILWSIERDGRVFAIADDPSPDWDLKLPGPVDLCAGSVRIRMRYVGYGNLHGRLQLVLVPVGESGDSLSSIVAALGGRYPPDASIQRVDKE